MTLAISLYNADVSIRIFTRQGCPLCDAGIALAYQVFGTTSLEIIDVDLDLTLLERYGDRVPVIEDSEGMIIDEGIIDEAVLMKYDRDSHQPSAISRQPES